jgi:hypothetical protein
MTLDEARNAIGKKVIYTPSWGFKEQGIITSVNETYVFVKFLAINGGYTDPLAANTQNLEIYTTEKWFDLNDNDINAIKNIVFNLTTICL